MQYGKDDLKFCMAQGEPLDDIHDLKMKIIALLMEDDTRKVDTVFNALSMTALDILVQSNINPERYTDWIDHLAYSMKWNLRDKGFIEGKE